MNGELSTGAAVVYGDADTVENHADDAREIARRHDLDIGAWHSDPTGTRSYAALDDAGGLVAALGDCARLGAALLVPYAVDMPGERAWRLVGHWLNRRGLRLYIGNALYNWGHTFDEVDFAIRHTLDAAHALDVAVIARGALPSIEALAREIAGADALRRSGTAPSALDTDPRFWWLRLRRDRDFSAGLDVPPPPDPSASWPIRRAQARVFATWLYRYASQSVIADVLNACGVPSREGGHWNQPMVSRLLRGRYVERPGRHAA